MKKLLFIFAFLASLFTSNKSEAQQINPVSFTGTTVNPSGNIYNTTTDTLLLTVSGYYSPYVTIHALVTKTSGTMAGTVRLYGSNYSNANTTGAWVAVSDTLTLSNSTTNQKVWTVPINYKYYMILQSGGTTVAGTLQAKAFALKPYN